MVAPLKAERHYIKAEVKVVELIKDIKLALRKNDNG